MRLPLKWARIGFVLIVACLGTMLLSFFAPTLRLLFLGFGLALVLACIGIYIRFHYLRCPHCGEAACPPRWDPGEKFHCPICGATFLFDDGTPKNSEQ